MALLEFSSGDVPQLILEFQTEKRHDVPHQDDFQKELELWQRRLQKRREQKALFGASADPSIDIEIEDIETRIERLQADLAGLEEASSQPTAHKQGEGEPAVAIEGPSTAPLGKATYYNPFLSARPKAQPFPSHTLHRKFNHSRPVPLHQPHLRRGVGVRMFP